MYDVKEQLGGGTFGSVWHATVSTDGADVALKRCPILAKDVLAAQTLGEVSREVRLHEDLKEQGDPEAGTYVNQLTEAFVTHVRNSAERATLTLNLVFPLCEMSLRSFLPTLQNESKQSGDLTLVAQLAADMLLGLHTLHALGIAHRDVKPCNMLVQCNAQRRGVRRAALQICDLGAAKRLGGGSATASATQLSTPFIVSLPYRAPELLWGSIRYTCTIDIWSAGCVAAEMFLSHPLFYPTSEADMSFQVLSMLGAPTKAELRAMRLPQRATQLFCDELKLFERLSLTRERLAETAHMPLSIPEPAMELIKDMLRFSPDERPTCEQALREHSFVRDTM